MPENDGYFSTDEPSLLITYGSGEFVEGATHIRGQILLGPHKIFLRGADGDLSTTFVPLEKIYRVRLTWQALEVSVRPVPAMQTIIQLRADRKHLKELARDLVKRRRLQKRFWRSEWFDPEF